LGAWWRPAGVNGACWRWCRGLRACLAALSGRAEHDGETEETAHTRDDRPSRRCVPRICRRDPPIDVHTAAGVPFTVTWLVGQPPRGERQKYAPSQSGRSGSTTGVWLAPRTARGSPRC
jgi:hypothetical protein